MKKLLLAGAALSLLAVAAPPARSQFSTVAVAGDTCPAATVYPAGNNRPLILTQTGTLCTSGSGGGGGGGAITIASGAAVDGWSVTHGSTTDVSCATDTGTCTIEALTKRINVSMSALVAAIGSSIPAGSAIIGKVSQVDSAGTDATDTTNHSVKVTIASSPGLISAINSAIPAGTNLIGNVGVGIASTTSGQSGPLAQCAVTTSAPTYTTAQTDPLSCDTTGALRISAPAASPVNVTVTTPPNDVLTGPTSLTGAGDVVVNTQGSGSAGLQITGTFTGLSGIVQGSVDGTNYQNIPAFNATSGTAVLPATAITATGLWFIPPAGYRSIRYHVTAVSTGTAVVSLNASAGSIQPLITASGAAAVDLLGVNGATIATGNGTVGANVLRVAIASNNTAFSVNAQPTPVTSGGLSTFSEIVPANTTSVAVKASAGQVYDIEMGSNSATPLSSPLYVKFYDAAQGSTTCGSGTPKSRYVFTGGSNVSIPLGEAFATAISACVVAGIADNDATAPAATTFVLTVHYK